MNYTRFSSIQLKTVANKATHLTTLLFHFPHPHNWSKYTSQSFLMIIELILKHTHILGTCSLINHKNISCWPLVPSGGGKFTVHLLCHLAPPPPPVVKTGRSLKKKIFRLSLPDKTAGGPASPMWARTGQECLEEEWFFSGAQSTPRASPQAPSLLSEAFTLLWRTRCSVSCCLV